MLRVACAKVANASAPYRGQNRQKRKRGFRGQKKLPFPSAPETGRFPVLPFLVFLENCRKTPKKQGFFIPAEPLKSLEKKGKTLKKQGILRRGKKQGIPKKQGKEGQIQKGTAGRGREKKCHDNLRQTSRQLTTCHDNLRHFMTISVSFFHWHKTS